MMRLDVWLTLPDGALKLIGELAFGDADNSGRYASGFRYTQAWAASRNAFPIDPGSLPLAGGDHFESQNLWPPLAVFDDALPDDWGRRVLVADRKLPRGQQSEPYLLRALSADGLGALAFSESGKPAQKYSPASVLDLADLLEAARRFEAGIPLEDERMRRLLAAGGSAGGARPKALVSADGEEWIAKFPSRYKDGRFDVVGLEAAAMILAVRAKLIVPKTRLEVIGEKKTLLVKRFDITEQGGRVHMISLRTLCKERPGAYILSYREVADTIRKLSADPAEDAARFYRLAVFNAMLGNTDDHLKNFWMINAGAGYRLSPAFDLVPDVAEKGEHTLCFDLAFSPPVKNDWLKIGKLWGVRGALSIVEEVAEAMSAFESLARQSGVPAENIASIKMDIDKRRTRCLA